MKHLLLLSLLGTLVANAGAQPARPPGPPPPRKEAAQRYSLEQAMSDRAQLHTIAFDGLAFLTGDFAQDTFLPPGKVSDYFGFQYMRDVDANEAGHSTSFLTRIAHNMLTILDDAQRAQLLDLARLQEQDIRRFAEMRLPLIDAFRRNLQGKLPAGTTSLDRGAVMRHSAELYALDGALAYQRAKVMASIVRGWSDAQRSALAPLRFGDSRTWPQVPAPAEPRGMSRTVHVAVMTYASEMFSWWAGSLEADTYFCPERHGMYFGGFGLKTAPAMGKKDYAISTTLTGDSGEAFLAVLDESQRNQLLALPDLQRRELAEIASVRRSIAAELRRFLHSEVADRDRVLSLSRRYGELDGHLSYLYAVAFARIGQSLSAQQKVMLSGLRTVDPQEPKGPFLYSQPQRNLKVEGSDSFFR